MKIFISADIEGTAGITNWDEAAKTHADYQEFRHYMTDELVAACEGARAAGATDILVKDAHSSGRNLVLSKLPDYVRIVRGWSGHPDSMMFGIDESFDAAIYTGYHSRAGSDANPLAHSFNLRVQRLLINGEMASEYTINAMCAARYGVPSVFLSGDANMCDEARQMVPAIATVETMQGIGAATMSLSPAASVKAIREGVRAALSRNLKACQLKLPEHCEMVVEYSNPMDAYRASWYPGMDYTAERTVRLKTDDFFEVERALRFI